MKENQSGKKRYTKRQIEIMAETYWITDLLARQLEGTPFGDRLKRKRDGMRDFIKKNADDILRGGDNDE